MTLEYKGIKINYQVSGKGKPLLFLHGFLENLTMWNNMIPYFSNSHQCITVDLLGHGRTDCLGYIHSMEEMAKAVKYLSDELVLDDIKIIGHSMGGYVALAYLDLFPKMVSGLLLLNSTSFADSKDRKIHRDRAIQIIKKNPKAYMSTVIENLFAKENRPKFSTQIDRIQNEASKTSQQGIISALEGMKTRKDRSAILSNFKGSKAIFAGKQDPVLSYQQSVKESKESITNLISFDGGHMTYLENKNEFIKLLHQFLRACLNSIQTDDQ